MIPGTIGRLLSTGAGLAYGLFYLAIALGYSVTQKDFWLGQDPAQKILYERASRNLWSLRESLEGIKHKFLKLKDGTQLHYLLAARGVMDSAQLVIFLHGFPDSAHLFSRHLTSSQASKATLVALDLPGCGGSDSIARYGPDEVLNRIAEAIVLLKRLYIHPQAAAAAAAAPTPQHNAKCILVGHDWGGVIGFRLAAETTGLIDHFVAINSLYPAFAEANLRTRCAAARLLLQEWKFGAGFDKLAPVFSQLTKSSYTYMLTLPLPLAKLLPALTLSLIEFAHSLEYHDPRLPAPSPEEIAIRLAMAYGPGPTECKSTADDDDGSAYGPSVYDRSLTQIPGDWDGRVQLYAHGLLRQKWTPSYPGHNTTAIIMDGDKHFRCPVDIIFGMRDVALDPRIAVDGIEEYFFRSVSSAETGLGMRESRLVRLPGCGHWSLLEEEGERALDELLGAML